MGSVQDRLSTAVGLAPTQPAQQTQPAQPAQPDKATLAKNEAGWKAFLGDPRVKSGLLQFGANLLAGSGMGQAVGGGVAAVGRSEQARLAAEEQARQAALDERKMRLQEQAAQQRAAASRGGGGSGGSAAAPAGVDWGKEISTWDAARVKQSLDPNTQPMNPGERIAFASYMDRATKLAAVNPNINLGTVFAAYTNNPVAAEGRLAALEAGNDPTAISSAPPAAATPAAAAPNPLTVQTPDNATPEQQSLAAAQSKALQDAAAAQAVKDAAAAQVAQAADAKTQTVKGNQEFSRTVYKNLRALAGATAGMTKSEHLAFVKEQLRIAWPQLSLTERTLIKNSYMEQYMSPGMKVK